MSNREYNFSSELANSKTEIDTSTINSVIQEDRRLMILLFLIKSCGYSSNGSLISNLLELGGHHTNREALHGDYSWLEKHSLVKHEDTEFGMVVLTLTQTGWDVAMGRQLLPGVRRPYPGEIEKWKLDVLG